MASNPELREFLRSRRARLTPAEAGIVPTPGPRRVPGLRREELAHLAGISADYYVRLEQGRGGGASADVLDALARALRLDETEREHLYRLAKPGPARRRRTSGRQRVRPGVRVLIDSLATPAFVIGRRTDVLAANAIARALLPGFDPPEGGGNYARWVSLDPAQRDLYLDWEEVARDTVATLRLDAGRHPDDPLLDELIGELSAGNAEFRTWWAEHDVLQRSHGSKLYRHPVVGKLAISYEALQLPGDPDQTLFAYSVDPGSRSAEAMELLASWTAEGAALRG